MQLNQEVDLSHKEIAIMKDHINNILTENSKFKKEYANLVKNFFFYYLRINFIKLIIKSK